MLKKLIVLSMCLFACVGLTGCGLKYLNPLAWPDIFEDISEELTMKDDMRSVKEFVAENSTRPQSRETAEAGKEACAAYDSAVSARDQSNYWHSLIPDIPIVGGFGNGIIGGFADIFIRPDTKERDAMNAKNNYDSLCSQDSLLQQSYKIDTGDIGMRRWSLGELSVPLMVMIFLFAFLMLLALLKILKAKAKRLRKGGKKAAIIDAEAKAEARVLKAQQELVEAQVKAVEAQPQAQIPQCQTFAIADKERMGTDAGQQRLLLKQCNKRGLNPDAILAQCGGNVYTANEFIMSAAPEQLEAFKA